MINKEIACALLCLHNDLRIMFEKSTSTVRGIQIDSLMMNIPGVDYEYEYLNKYSIKLINFKEKLFDEKTETLNLVALSL
jgi:hypothetical protein